MIRSQPLEMDPELLDLISEWERARDLGQPRQPEDLCAESPEWLSLLRVWITQLTAFDRQFSDNRPRSDHNTEQTELSLPGFEILEEIGRGGMGIVYKARQISLDRLVAVKMINGRIWGNANLVARLRSEAAALARLKHEHVIQVHDVIEHHGCLCLILEYIDGTNLASRNAGSTVDPRLAARIGLTVARTMSDIHQTGLLHRDLKPANLLQDERGTIKISDFGLAKHHAADSSDTIAGEIIGTPNYMAPEQAAGTPSATGVWTDVYAIGATLYDFLTGRPPFLGATLLGTLDQVRHNDPVSPRLLVPQVPRDLETIVLKCLEKEPRKRYATASALASDLENFLAGRPVTARPLTVIGQGWRWSKRYPERALTLLGLVLITLFGAGFATRLADAHRETDLKNRALNAELEKSHAQELSLLGARIRERTRNQTRGWIEQNLADLRQVSRHSMNDETRRMLRSEAIRALCAPRLEFAGQVIGGFDAYSLAYSPDGKYLAVGSNVSINGFGTIILFDAETRQEKQRLTFGPSEELLRRSNPTDGVRSLRFTPDNKYLLVGTRGGMIQRWNLETSELERAWQAHHDYVLSIHILPTRGFVVSISEDRQLKFWDWNGNLLQEEVVKHRQVGESIAVSGDCVYVRIDQSLLEFYCPPGTSSFQPGWKVSCPGAQMVIHPDQQTLLASWEDSLNGADLVAINVISGEVQNRWSDPRRFAAHAGEFHAVDVAPSGRWFLSSAQDGIKVWDLVSREVAATLPNTANSRVPATFHPRREEFAVSREGRVEIWQLQGNDVWDSALNHSSPVNFIDLSADGRLLAGAITSKKEKDAESEVSVWIADLNHAGNPGEQISADVPTKFLGMSKNGDFLVHGAPPHTSLVLRKLDESDSIMTTLPFLRNTRKPVFSPNGDQVWYSGLAKENGAGVLMAVDTRPGHKALRWVNERSEREFNRSAILSLAVGSHFVAASSIDGVMRLFDPSDGRLVREIEVANQIIDVLALSSDEQSVLCGTRSGHLLVFRTSDGLLKTNSAIHDEPITSLSTAKDGLVATGSADGTVILWQFDDGAIKERFRLGPFHKGVTEAILSREGNLLSILVEGEFGVRLLRMGELRNRLAELELDWP